MSSARLATLYPEDVSSTQAPAHWLLAHFGKRVLRPGGVKLTRWLLEEMDIGREDEVVEFAPGVGATTQWALKAKPKSYIAVEPNPFAQSALEREFSADHRKVIQASAERTGLAEGSASVVFGEAFLTMQTQKVKETIMAEAHRVLRSGGRYGLHELCLLDTTQDEAKELRKELSEVLRVNATPLTPIGWSELLLDAGFKITAERIRPMELLESSRLIEDEGLLGSAKLAWNLAHDPKALKRVFLMQRLFRKYRRQLGAIGLVARR